MESSIHLTLPLSQIHHLLNILEHSPPDPQTTSILQLVQAALSPSSPSHTDMGVDTLMGDPAMDPIGEELLALAETSPKVLASTAMDAMEDSDLEDWDSDLDINQALLGTLGLQSYSEPAPSHPKRSGPRGGVPLAKPKKARGPTTANLEGENEPRFVQAANTALCGNHTAHSFIAALSGTTIELTASWAQDLKTDLIVWQRAIGDSLPAMIHRCQSKTSSNFALMLGNIQLLMKCQR